MNDFPEPLPQPSTSSAPEALEVRRAQRELGGTHDGPMGGNGAGYAIVRDSAVPVLSV